MSNLKREPTEVWIVTEADRSLRVCRSRDEAERHTRVGAATYCRFVPAEPEQAGKAQGCATGDVLEVGDAPNGQCEVILRCSKEQARRWGKLLYETVTVVPAPPTKEGT